MRIQPNERRALEAWKHYYNYMKTGNAAAAENWLMNFDYELKTKIPQVFAKFARIGRLEISDEDFLREFRLSTLF